MQQIRLGLRKKLDISKYAKVENSWMKMKLIRYSLIEKVDVSRFLEEDLTEEKVNFIVNSIVAGIDIRKHPVFQDNSLIEVFSKIAFKDKQND